MTIYMVGIVAFVLVIAGAALTGWCDGRRKARIERRCGARRLAA